MITIAIDYDGTWTADPEAFAAFANLLRRRGHRVIIVTARVSGVGEVYFHCEKHVDRIVPAVQPTSATTPRPTESASTSGSTTCPG